MPLQLFIGSLNREAPYFQGARGVGLSAYRFDEDALRFEKQAEANDIDNPTFLSVTPDGTRLFANSEVFGWKEGTVSAYAVDPVTGALRYLNKQPCLGSITAYNSIVAGGRMLAVANYGMGSGGPDQSVAIFGIGEDGTLTPAIASVAHSGAGVDESRQERAHAHSVIPGPAPADFLLVADLGLDQLVVYRLGGNGQLTRHGAVQLPPGAGPRHMVFHPSGRWLFVMNELDSTVASLSWQDGEMAIVDRKPAVPEDARAHNHCADIHISPDGRFVYGSNRGHDSLVIFAVEEGSGALELVGFQPTLGKTPRNFAITPSGRHILVANQNSDNIVVIARDSGTGRLSDTGARLEIGTPMCVRVVAR